jgi:aromatic-amino-acid transaminase
VAAAGSNKTFKHTAADGTADLAALKAALEEAEASDLVLLHGCCHNPPASTIPMRSGTRSPRC